MKGKSLILPLCLLLLGSGLILLGVLLGEPQTVFAKAVRICLECIGFG